MAHTEIIVTGSPVNPDLTTLIDFNIAFQAFGLAERYEITGDSVARADDGLGTLRASSVASLAAGGSPRLSSDVAHRPAFVAGGGPNGLSDALRFDRTRADGLSWSPAGPTGKHTMVELFQPGHIGAQGDTGQLFSSNTGSATSQNGFFVSQGAGNLIGVQAYVGSAGSFIGASGGSVTEGQWVAAIKTFEPATGTLNVGLMAAGSNGSVSWGTGVKAGVAITATGLSFGAGPGFTSRGFTGLSAGSLLFIGHDARAEADLLDAIRAWAFGPDSRFGL